MIDLEARAAALNERAVVEALPIEQVFSRARRFRARRRIGAAGLAIVVTLSGTAVAVWAHSDGGSDVRTVATPSAPGPARPKDEAERLARDLIGRAVLPTGARVYSGSAPAALARALFTEATPNLIDRHRIWIVDGTVDEIVGFLFPKPHWPAQMENGYTSPGASSVNGVTVEWVQYQDRSPHSSDIASSTMTMSVTRRSNTTVWVRADAQVVWRARRDPRERVPAADHVVVITRDATTDSGSGSTAVTVTDTARVANLRRAFNSLLVAVPATSNGCTQDTTYVLRFAATPSAKPDVVAALSCGAAHVTIDGKPTATLEAAELYLTAFELFGNNELNA